MNVYLFTNNQIQFSIHSCIQFLFVNRANYTCTLLTSLSRGSEIQEPCGVCVL